MPKLVSAALLAAPPPGLPPTRAHTPFFNDSTFSIILTQGMPGVELRGFLGVLDIQARAHQYDGLRVPFALPVAFLM